MPKTLTPEQEAKAFDRKRFGDDAELTPEERKKQKERINNLQSGEDKAKEDRLNAVADFDTDPLGYLKEKLAVGNYEGRDREHNYLLLVSLIKIQNALESFNLNLKSRK